MGAEKDAVQIAFERTVASLEAETPTPTTIPAPEPTPTPQNNNEPPATPTEVVTEPTTPAPTPDSGVQIKKIEAPTEPTTPIFDWKAEFKKESGIDFEEAQKIIKAPKEEYTELAKRINAAEKAGKTKEFLRIQSTDWDSEPEERIVKSALKKEYGLSDEDIDQLFQSRYKLDEGEFSPSEVATAKILLKADAAKHRQSLKAEQIAAYEGFKPAEQTAEEKEAQRQNEIERDRLKAEAFDIHSKFNELEVALPDKGVAVTFPITPEQKEQMKPYLDNPAHIFDQFYTKEGKWNNQKWVKFVANMVTQEQALPAMLSKYANSVLDEDVKQRKNFTLDKSGNPVSSAAPASSEDELKKYFAVH